MFLRKSGFFCFLYVFEFRLENFSLKNGKRVDFKKIGVGVENRSITLILFSNYMRKRQVYPAPGFGIRKSKEREYKSSKLRPWALFVFNFIQTSFN